MRPAQQKSFGLQVIVACVVAFAAVVVALFLMS